MEDLDLVKGVLLGNIKFFEEILRKYEGGINRFLFYMVGNKESAEDLTQEVFISAYNKLYTFKQRYKFSTWLYQIAKNKAIDYCRKCNGLSKIYLEEGSFVSNDASVESLVEYKETKRYVEKFIKTLSDIDRQILILRYSNDDITFLDIAEIVNMGESAVKKRYYKAYERYEVFLKTNSSFENINESLGRVNNGL